MNDTDKIAKGISLANGKKLTFPSLLPLPSTHSVVVHSKRTAYTGSEAHNNILAEVVHANLFMDLENPKKELCGT